MDAAQLLADDARHPHRRTCSTAGVARLRGPRGARRARARRPGASTPATSWSRTCRGPGVEEQIDNEKYEFKPRDWADGRRHRHRPAARPAQRDPPRAPRAAAAAQPARCTRRPTTRSSASPGTSTPSTPRPAGPTPSSSSSTSTRTTPARASVHLDLRGARAATRSAAGRRARRALRRDVRLGRRGLRPARPDDPRAPTWCTWWRRDRDAPHRPATRASPRRRPRRSRCPAAASRAMPHRPSRRPGRADRRPATGTGPRCSTRSCSAAFSDSVGRRARGDLRGLIDRLDYLQWLGIDCLWLPPFYPSPAARRRLRRRRLHGDRRRSTARWPTSPSSSRRRTPAGCGSSSTW